MKRYLFFTIISLICSGCQNSGQAASDKQNQSQIIYDLNESTEIIMQLIKENSLKELLEDTDPQQMAILLKNFSPSEMAMEAEILNYNGIAGAIFYKRDDHWSSLQKALLEVAKKHPDIKFVQVDAEILFKVTQNAQIETFPAIIFLKDRKEIDRIEPDSFETVQEIENIIKKLTM